MLVSHRFNTPQRQTFGLGNPSGDMNPEVEKEEKPRHQEYLEKQLASTKAKLKTAKRLYTISTFGITAVAIGSILFNKSQVRKADEVQEKLSQTRGLLFEATDNKIDPFNIDIAIALRKAKLKAQDAEYTAQKVAKATTEQATKASKAAAQKALELRRLVGR